MLLFIRLAKFIYRVFSQSFKIMQLMAINYLQYCYQVYLIFIDKSILRFVIGCNAVFTLVSFNLNELFNRVKMPQCLFN